MKVFFMEGKLMYMRIKLMIVFVSLLTLVFALNLGVASAHSPSNPNFQGEHADDPSPSPVGKNAFDPEHPGQFKGFDVGNAVAGITHNPNCPLHHH